jgi:hypothetical protein
VKRAKHSKADSPELVAAYQPARMAHAPVECNLALPKCWVEVGRIGLDGYPKTRDNGAPRCAACGGKIR